jgi:hypothetical protein
VADTCEKPHRATPGGHGRAPIVLSTGTHSCHLGPPEPRASHGPDRCLMPPLSLRAAQPAGGADPLRPVVDVVVPVHDEEADLGPCLRRLHRHLTEHLPYPFRITVAENASTDGTVDVARRVAAELPGIEVLVLPEPGRGRALRTAWLGSDAPVLVYMDVDLSTDLAALLPLVAPLISGHSDLAIGTRLAPSSRVVRLHRPDRRRGHAVRPQPARRLTSRRPSTSFSRWSSSAPHLGQSSTITGPPRRCGRPQTLPAVAARASSITVDSSARQTTTDPSLLTAHLSAVLARPVPAT